VLGQHLTPAEELENRALSKRFRQEQVFSAEVDIQPCFLPDEHFVHRSVEHQPKQSLQFFG
jgi:hypothetical protein